MACERVDSSEKRYRLLVPDHVLPYSSSNLMIFKVFSQLDLNDLRR
jgi:hypothetical protein